MRLGALPTGEILNEAKNIASSRGQETTEIDGKTRKELIDLVVKQVGFEGFLTELSLLIKKEAVEGLMAQAKTWSSAKRQEQRVGKDIRKWAEERVNWQISEGSGIDIRSNITEAQAPMYSMRTAFATPSSEYKKYMDKYGTMPVPKEVTEKLSDKQKENYSDKYRRAKATAVNINTELRSAAGGAGTGAYADMIRTTTDVLYKQQEEIGEIVTSLNKENLDAPPPGISGLKDRVLTRNGVSSFANSVIDMKSGMKDELERLSDLAGVPGLSDTEMKDIEGELSTGFRDIAKKRPDMSPEDIDNYVKDNVRKAQALAQLDRVIKGLVSKQNEMRVLQELLPRKPGAVSAGMSSYEDSRRENIQKFRDKVKIEDRIRNDLHSARTMASEGDVFTGGPRTPTGGFSDSSFSTTSGPVPVYLVGADSSVVIGVRGLESMGLLSPESGFAEGFKVLNETEKKLADVVAKVSPKFKEPISSETYFSPSRLSGGGSTYGGTKISPYDEEARLREQFNSLVKSMTTDDKTSSPTLDWGTVLHAKIQKAFADNEKFDIERYGDLEDEIGGTLGGTADLIEYKDKDKKKVKSIIDIKSTVPEFFEKLKKTIDKIGSTDIKDVMKNLDEDHQRKLNDYFSQLNAYLKVFDATDATAELRFYDKTDLGKDVGAYQSVTMKFDPERFKKDMKQLAAAREAVRASGEKFTGIQNVPEFRPDANQFPSNEELEEAMRAAQRLTKPDQRNRAARMFASKNDSFGREQSKGIESRFKEWSERQASANLSSEDLAKYLNVTPIAEGSGTRPLLTNLTTLHDQAKLYQRMKGVSKDILPKMPDEIGAAITAAETQGPDYQNFIDLTNKLRERFEKFGSRGLNGKSFSGKDLTDAWKLYRGAVGDFMIKQAEDSYKQMKEYEASGDVRESHSAHGAFESRTKDMQEFVRKSIGKRTDIYTDDKRFPFQAVAEAAGVYMNPKQIMEKIGEPLGNDDKLIEMFTNVSKGLQGSDLKAPVETARGAFRELSDMNTELVKILGNAEKVKRIGSGVIEAWDFDKLATRATRLREALQQVVKQTGELNPEQEQNINNIIKYLKSLESMYSSMNLKNPDKGYGQTGIVPVPTKIEDPETQRALHARNLQAAREYLRRPEEAGGQPVGEPFSYTEKVVGPAGEVIKNVRHDFKKYGEEVLASGEKVGRFSEVQVDLVEKMQRVNATFANATRRVIMWGAASRLIYGGVSYLSKSLDELSNIEMGMAQLRMVMNPITTDFGKMSKSATGFAKQYGVPVTDIMKSMKVFAQQGLTQEEILDRTKTATLASNVTTLNAKEATEALTAAMKVFREEGDQSLRFLDAWSEVEAKHAVTAEDMANAIKKSAAAAKVAGFTFDQLNGIVAAIGATTRQSGKEVGTSMRFIARRLFSEEGPKALAKLPKPITTITGSGELKSGFGVLNELSTQWKDLTKAQRLNIATAIGGTRQYNALLVAMDHWDEVLRGISNSTNSKGSAERRNLEVMKTYAKQLEQTRAAATELKMEVGAVVLPTFKVGLKALKLLTETITGIPGPVKLAATSALLMFGAFAKGVPIIDSIVETISKGKSVLGGFGDSFSKQFDIAKFEITGKGKSKDTFGLKTLTSDAASFANMARAATAPFTEQGKGISDFHSSLGKVLFTIKEVGLAYNEMLGKGTINIGAAGEKVGEAGKAFGGFFSVSGKMYADKKAGPKDALRALQKEAVYRGLGKDSVKVAMKGGLKGMTKLAGKALGFAGELGGLATSIVGDAIDTSGEYVGAAGHKAIKSFASQNTGLIKAVAPLAVTIGALAPALGAVYDEFQKLTRSAQDFEKSMDSVRKTNEGQLKSIRGMMSSYDTLYARLQDIRKASDPKTKARRMELGTYEAPLTGMQKVQSSAIDLSNRIAENNLDLVIGYDKLGNAVLKTTGNFKSYIKELEKVKVLQGVQTELDVLEKFTSDLSETEGPEKFKVAIKELADAFPVIGELVSRNIKIGPAKALELATDDLNKRLNLKQKYPMAQAADDDIKKRQEVLAKARSSFQDSYSDFENVYKGIFSQANLKGLGPSDIEKILTSPVLQKAYELRLNIDPKFKLVSGVTAKDIMGKELLSALNPNTAGVLDVTSQFTKANLESSGISARADSKVYSGDVVTMFDDAAKKYDIAGNQAIVKLKKTSDGVFMWMAEYFNTKTLKVEERPFSEVESLVDSIFPIQKIQEDLSYRMDSLNTFVSGAAAGLSGITEKSFKKDFNLGSRFFSDVPTTTLLQGSKGFMPTQGYGEVEAMKGFKDDIDEYFFKPMEELRRKTEQLDKLKLEGIDSGDTNISKDFYEEINRLLDILKNNQVVLQFKAVFVDLMKEMSAGQRILKEEIAILSERTKLNVTPSGLAAGSSKELENLDLGVRGLREVTSRQMLLARDPKFREQARGLREEELKSQNNLGMIDKLQRALVGIEDISQVASGFGASLSKEDLSKYIEKIIPEGKEDTFYELKQIDQNIAANTADTVAKLGELINAVDRNPVTGMQAGGKVIGSGHGTSDDNLRALGYGEFVVKRKSTDAIGQTTLDYINKHGKLPKMATGGSVDKKEGLLSKLTGPITGYATGVVGSLVAAATGNLPLAVLGGVLTAGSALYGLGKTAGHIFGKFSGTKEELEKKDLDKIKKYAAGGPVKEKESLLDKLGLGVAAGTFGTMTGTLLGVATGNPLLALLGGALSTGALYGLKKAKDSSKEELEKKDLDKIKKYAAGGLVPKESLELPDPFVMSEDPAAATARNMKRIIPQKYRDVLSKLPNPVIDEKPKSELDNLLNKFPSFKKYATGGMATGGSVDKKEGLLSKLSGSISGATTGAMGALTGLATGNIPMAVFGGGISALSALYGLGKTIEHFMGKSPSKDDTLAAVSSGEYVLNKDSVKKLGIDKLKFMNETGKIPAFASGGLVGAGLAPGPDTSLDKLLRNLATKDDVSKFAKASSLMPLSALTNELERVARMREKAENKGDQRAVMQANDSLNVLSKQLVEREGYKGGLDAVKNNFTIFKKRFKPEEFQQRVFSGVDPKVLLEKLKKHAPEEKGLFGTSLFGKTALENSRQFKKLEAAQQVRVKQSTFSSKNLARIAAATTALATVQKYGNTKIITKLDDQIDILDQNIADARQEGKPYGEIESLVKKREALSVNRRSKQKESEFYGTAKAMGTIGFVSTELAKSFGLTEKQIKLLGVGAVGTYAAMSVASKITGEGLPDSAKKFGEDLKDITKKYMQGEDISAIDLVPLKKSAYNMTSDFAKETKRVFGNKNKEIEKEVKSLDSGKIYSEIDKSIEARAKDLVAYSSISEEHAQFADLRRKHGEARKEFVNNSGKYDPNDRAYKDLLNKQSAEEHAFLRGKNKKELLDKYPSSKNTGELGKYVRDSLGPELENAGGHILEGLEKSNAPSKLKQAIVAYLAVALSDYASNKNADKTVLADTEKIMKQQSEAFAELLLKYPEAAEAALAEIYTSASKATSEIPEIARVDKSLVQDTQVEKEKIKKQIKEVQDTYVEAQKESLEKQRKLQIEMADKEIRGNDSKAAYSAVADERNRMIASNINRKYSLRNILQPGLEGYGGDVEMAVPDYELNSQQSIYADATKEAKTFVSGLVRSFRGLYRISPTDTGLKAAIDAYSDGPEKLEAMKRRMNDLSTRMMEEADLANTTTDPDEAAAAEERHRKLATALREQTKAADEFAESLRSFGQAYMYLDRFTNSIIELQSSLREISVQEAVDWLPGVRQSQQAAERMLGGASPFARTSVMPDESRMGVRTGVNLRHLQSTGYDLERAKILDQLRNASGQQAADLNQQLADLPERYKRIELAREQGRYDEGLKRSISPFQDQLQSLERVKNLPGLDDDVRDDITKYQEQIAKAMEHAFDRMPVSEYIEDLKDNEGKIREGLGDRAYETELERANKIADAGIKNIYRGVTLGDRTDITGGFTDDIRDALKDSLKDSSEGLQLEANISDPIVNKLDETNSLLKAIADQEFGLSTEKPGLLDWALGKDYLDISKYTAKASGGPVFGAGSATSDSIPALLSNGEYVVNTDSARRVGYGNLEFMNNHGKLPGFAAGGKAGFNEIKHYYEVERLKKDRGFFGNLAAEAREARLQMGEDYTDYEAGVGLGKGLSRVERNRGAAASLALQTGAAVGETVTGAIQGLINFAKETPKIYKTVSGYFDRRGFFGVAKDLIGLGGKGLKEIYKLTTSKDHREYRAGQLQRAEGLLEDYIKEKGITGDLFIDIARTAIEAIPGMGKIGTGVIKAGWGLTKNTAGLGALAVKKTAPLVGKAALFTAGATAAGVGYGGLKGAQLVVKYAPGLAKFVGKSGARAFETLSPHLRAGYEQTLAFMQKYGPIAGRAGYDFATDSLPKAFKNARQYATDTIKAAREYPARKAAAANFKNIEQMRAEFGYPFKNAKDVADFQRGINQVHIMDDLTAAYGSDAYRAGRNYILGKGPGRTTMNALASGGQVSGPGTGTSDSIPALLSDGEYVVKAASVQKIGPQTLDYINTHGRPPGFAAGGAVNVEEIQKFINDISNTDLSKVIMERRAKRGSYGSIRQGEASDFNNEHRIINEGPIDELMNAGFSAANVGLTFGGVRGMFGKTAASVAKKAAPKFFDQVIKHPGFYSKLLGNTLKATVKSVSALEKFGLAEPLVKFASKYGHKVMTTSELGSSTIKHHLVESGFRSGIERAQNMSLLPKRYDEGGEVVEDKRKKSLTRKFFDWVFGSKIEAADKKESRYSQLLELDEDEKLIKKYMGGLIRGYKSGSRVRKFVVSGNGKLKEVIDGVEVDLPEKAQTAVRKFTAYGDDPVKEIIGGKSISLADKPKENFRRFTAYGDGPIKEIIDGKEQELTFAKNVLLSKAVEAKKAGETTEWALATLAETNKTTREALRGRGPIDPNAIPEDLRPYISKSFMGIEGPTEGTAGQFDTDQYREALASKKDFSERIKEAKRIRDRSDADREFLNDEDKTKAKNRRLQARTAGLANIEGLPADYSVMEFLPGNLVRLRGDGKEDNSPDSIAYQSKYPTDLSMYSPKNLPNVEDYLSKEAKEISSLKDDPIYAKVFAAAAEKRKKLMKDIFNTEFSGDYNEFPGYLGRLKEIYDNGIKAYNVEGITKEEKDTIAQQILRTRNAIEEVLGGADINSKEVQSMADLAIYGGRRNEKNQRVFDDENMPAYGLAESILTRGRKAKYDKRLGVENSTIVFQTDPRLFMEFYKRESAGLLTSAEREAYQSKMERAKGNVGDEGVTASTSTAVTNTKTDKEKDKLLEYIKQNKQEKLDASGFDVEGPSSRITESMPLLEQLSRGKTVTLADIVDKISKKEISNFANKDTGFFESLLKLFNFKPDRENNNSVPVFHNGGIVQRTGLVFAEGGEVIIPKKLATGGNDFTPGVLSFDKPVMKLDTDGLLEALDNVKLGVETTKLSVDVGTATVPVEVGDAKVGVDTGGVTVGIDPNAKVGLDPSAKVGVNTEGVFVSIAKPDFTIDVNPNAKVGVNTEGVFVKVAEPTFTVGIDSSAKVDVNTDGVFVSVEQPNFSIPVDAAGITIPVDKLDVGIDTGPLESLVSSIESAVNNLTSSLSKINLSGSANAVGSERLDQLAETVKSFKDQLVFLKDEVDEGFKLVGQNANNETSDIDRRLVSMLGEEVGGLRRDVNDVRTLVAETSSKQRQYAVYIESQIDGIDYRLRMAQNIVGIGNGGGYKA
jgi:TP901 family phage tail tape measure protein